MSYTQLSDVARDEMGRLIELHNSTLHTYQYTHHLSSMSSTFSGVYPTNTVGHYINNCMMEFSGSDCRSCGTTLFENKRMLTHGSIDGVRAVVEVKSNDEFNYVAGSTHLVVIVSNSSNVVPAKVKQFLQQNGYTRMEVIWKTGSSRTSEYQRISNDDDVECNGDYRLTCLIVFGAILVSFLIIAMVIRARTTY